MNKNNYIGIALNELYRIFDLLNERYFSNKLEQPVITIQKAQKRGNLGWCTTSVVWKEEEEDEQGKFEINLSAEYLKTDHYELVDTLLHEMVHYMNAIIGAKDVGRGQKHNEIFKELAEKCDLIVENGENGWAYTSCSEELKEFIDEDIKVDQEVFKYFRIAPPKKERAPRQKTIFKYTCPNCQDTIKAKKGRQIICGLCDELYIIEEEGEEDNGN